LSWPHLDDENAVGDIYRSSSTQMLLVFVLPLVLVIITVIVVVLVLKQQQQLAESRPSPSSDRFGPAQFGPGKSARLVGRAYPMPLRF